MKSLIGKKCIFVIHKLYFVGYLSDNDDICQLIFTGLFKQAGWLTNQQSDLPKTLRYDLLSYKLFSKEKSPCILPFEFGYFAIIVIEVFF